MFVLQRDCLSRRALRGFFACLGQAYLWDKLPKWGLPRLAPPVASRNYGTKKYISHIAISTKFDSAKKVSRTSTWLKVMWTRLCRARKAT